MDLIWGKGAAATDAWLGSLDGAVVSPEASRVTHLVVRRGTPFFKRFLVPFERLARWDDEGLYLDAPIAEALGFPVWRRARRAPPPAPLTPRTGLILADGIVLRLKGLRLTQGSPSISHLVARDRGLSQRNLLVPVGDALELDSSHIAMRLRKTDLPALPAHRPDRDIENDLWETLYAGESISPIDLKWIKVRVADGLVELQGNVRTRAEVREAERLARSVSGVASLKNQLVSDWEIELAAASYIARQAPLLASGITVQTQLGAVVLEGRAPSGEAKDAIAQGLRSLPGVQRVSDLLQVPP